MTEVSWLSIRFGPEQGSVQRVASYFREMGHEAYIEHRVELEEVLPGELAEPGDIVRSRSQGNQGLWRVVSSRPAPGGGRVLGTLRVRSGRVKEFSSEWFEGDVVVTERSDAQP